MGELSEQESLDSVESNSDESVSATYYSASSQFESELPDVVDDISTVWKIDATKGINMVYGQVIIKEQLKSYAKSK